MSENTVAADICHVGSDVGRGREIDDFAGGDAGCGSSDCNGDTGRGVSGCSGGVDRGFGTGCELGAGRVRYTGCELGVGCELDCDGCRCGCRCGGCLWGRKKFTSFSCHSVVAFRRA